MNTGKVWLVGAGPGDVGLLTRKGEQVLKQAEVVVYDRLVGDGVLAMIPESAHAIDVGKNAGTPYEKSRRRSIRFFWKRRRRDIVLSG